MALNFQLPNNYRTNPDASFNNFFVRRFHIIIFKPSAYLSDETQLKKCSKEGLLRLNADPAF